MKKVLSRTVALCLAIVTMMFLASCANGKFATMQDYLSDKSVQSEIAEAKKSVESDDMKMEVTGEGNKLIYTYMIKMDLPENAAESLASGIEAQASTFQSLANSLKLVVSVENPTVVVRYVDKDGNEIYSKDFPAK